MKHGLPAISGPRDLLQTQFQSIPGFTGGIIVLQAGPELGGGVGPPFEGVLLIFEHTPRAARRNIATAIEAVAAPTISIGNQKSVQPPAADAYRYRSIHGNVYVFWNYPARYRLQSHRIVSECLKAPKPSEGN